MSPGWPLVAAPLPPLLRFSLFPLGALVFFNFFFPPLLLCAPVVSGFLWFLAPGALGLAILDNYCSDCAVCRATKSPKHSTAGNPVYTAIPEAPMRSVAMDVFAMLEVTVEEETYDCVIVTLDRHSGYIMAVPGKKSKKKDKKDKHGVGLQAKTVANAMIRH